MQLTMLVAMTRHRVIGNEGTLPWKLPSDLRRFKARTLGHPVLMGRRTWESLPKRPLPKRTNIVLSRDASYMAKGATVVTSVTAAVEEARASGAEEAFVIGGALVYAAALPIVDNLVVTHVDAIDRIEGDTHFPLLDWGDWRATSTINYGADYGNEHAFRIVKYQRVPTR